MADTPLPPNKPDHDGAGHRARLRQRLLGVGANSLGDHEIIEYLLATAIPRRDTKPLAKQLLSEFGGLGGVINADPEALARVKGMGDSAVAAIKVVQAATLRMLSNDVEKDHILSGWQALLDYLRADMAYRTNERVRVLHLNAKNRLLRDEVMSEGTIDQSAIYVREVLRRALDIGSSAVILVHNHPSGDPQPSRQDIAITRELIEAGRKVGVSVHDHIIMARTGHASMRALGLI